MRDWRRGSIRASRAVAALLAILVSGDAPLASAGVSASSDAVEAPTGALDFGEIDALVEQAVRDGKTPGAVVVVGRHDRILHRRAYGDRSVLPSRRDMTLDTIFDLASLTKPLVTATLAAWLIDRGELQLTDRVSKHLPRFSGQGKETITVEQLLLHTSGLPPSNPLREYRHGKDKARARAIRSVLEAYPGRRFIYSDVGYIVLGSLIERITGESLDATARRVLWSPLGMKDTRYCRRLCESPRIAPTELAGGRHTSPIRGEVQDPRAYYLGGVAGHAGLFSTVDDLSRFAQMLLNKGELDGKRLLSSEVVGHFTAPRDMPGGGVRSLGWDVLSTYSKARGVSLSERAFGHGGYTGTSFWVDPELDLFVIVLSNRNHPYGNGNVLHLQGTIADAAVQAVQHPSDERPSRVEIGQRRRPDDEEHPAAHAAPQAGRRLPESLTAADEAREQLRRGGG